MDKLRLYYPTKPWIVNQVWGILNPIYEQFGFKRHNGVDFRLGADSKLYSPIPGTVVRVGNQPDGGGIFLGVMSDVYEFEDGNYRVLLDFLHCKKLLVQEGQWVDIGTPLAVANNTGVSTGPHTHIQPRRVAFWNKEFGDLLAWTPADSNDANNTFDPQPYWTGFYAQDYGVIVKTMEATIKALKALVGVLSSKKQTP